MNQVKTEQILNVMRILSWVAFVGYMILAGSTLLSYGFSCLHPEGARNLYEGKDLYSLRMFNFWQYTLMVSLLVARAIMKAYAAYLVIQVLSKVSLANPFTMDVVKRLEHLSYVFLGIWVVGMVHNGHLAWINKLMGELPGDYISSESIFMAGMVFIISQIFKRGVEIQSENDLTV